MSMTKNKSVFDLDGAYLIATHFSKQINITEYDFKAQVNRRFVHDLFNAAVSQFNDKKASFNDVKQHINLYLKRQEIKKKISGCKFNVKNLKGNLALFALKTRNVLLMKFYHDLKDK